MGGTGNTVGLVRGEPPKTAKDPEEANPPAEAETKKESTWGDWLWEGSKWIPVAGAAPSAWDAGVAAWNGNYWEALGHVADGATAFGGPLGKGGKLLFKGGEKLVAKATEKAVVKAEEKALAKTEQKAAEKAAEKPGGKVKKDPCKNYNCGATSKKLENIKKEIKERGTELREDINELAKNGFGAKRPGLKPSETVEGHYDILDFYKANYAKLMAEYVACCGAEWYGLENLKNPKGLVK